MTSVSGGAQQPSHSHPAPVVVTTSVVVSVCENMSCFVEEGISNVFSCAEGKELGVEFDSIQERRPSSDSALPKDLHPDFSSEGEGKGCALTDALRHLREDVKEIGCF